MAVGLRNISGLASQSLIMMMLMCAVLTCPAEPHAKPEGGKFGAFIKDTLLGPAKP